MDVLGRGGHLDHRDPRVSGGEAPGQLLVAGSPDEVRGDPRVVEAYLGAPPEEVEAQLQEVVGDAPAQEAPSTEGAHRRRDEA